jgi:hypothetical protein
VARGVIVSRLDAGRKRIWRTASCPLWAASGAPWSGSRGVRFPNTHEVYGGSTDTQQHHHAEDEHAARESAEAQAVS